MDVLGVSGRLVKSGKEVITAGEMVYGGSQHVGIAVIQVNKKFPKITKYKAIVIAGGTKVCNQIRENLLTSFDTIVSKAMYL